MILHSRPWLTAADHAAVAAVLDSGMLAQGDIAAALEDEFAAWVGGAGAVAVASGTGAVLLALQALEVGSGDEVILPTYVCRSVLDAVRAAGADAVLCDVGPDWVVTPANIEPHLTARTRALIVPHMYGIYAPVAACRRFGVAVIEDCAQALGARAARPLAGDIAVYSFHPTKCLTSAEGGMCVSADATYVDRLRDLRDGGHSSARRSFAPLSDLGAALARAQLARYSSALARRAELAARYRATLDGLPAVVLPSAEPTRTMHFRFPLHCTGGLDAVESAFAQRGVAVRRGVDRLLHRDVGLADGAFRNAVAHFDRTVSLPLYPALSDDEHALCLAAALAVFAQLAHAGPLNGPAPA